MGASFALDPECLEICVHCKPDYYYDIEHNDDVGKSVPIDFSKSLQLYEGHITVVLKINLILGHNFWSRRKLFLRNARLLDVCFVVNLNLCCAASLIITGLNAILVLI